MLGHHSFSGWFEATRYGPIAQLVEPPAHNRSVPGSIPGGPTSTGNTGAVRQPKTTGDRERWQGQVKKDESAW